MPTNVPTSLSARTAASAHVTLSPAYRTKTFSSPASSLSHRAVFSPSLANSWITTHFSPAPSSHYFTKNVLFRLLIPGALSSLCLQPLLHSLCNPHHLLHNMASPPTPTPRLKPQRSLFLILCGLEVGQGSAGLLLQWVTALDVFSSRRDRPYSPRFPAHLVHHHPVDFLRGSWLPRGRTQKLPVPLVPLRPGLRSARTSLLLYPIGETQSHVQPKLKVEGKETSPLKRNGKESVAIFTAYP